MAASSSLRVITAPPKSLLFSFVTSRSLIRVGGWLTMQLILGSSSASRRQILAEMGYSFTLLVGDLPPCFLELFYSIISLFSLWFI